MDFGLTLANKSRIVGYGELSMIFILLIYKMILLIILCSLLLVSNDVLWTKNLQSYGTEDWDTC